MNLFFFYYGCYIITNNYAYIKNWEPLVFLPRFAIESKKGRSCLISKLSSVRKGKEKYKDI